MLWHTVVSHTVDVNACVTAWVSHLGPPSSPSFFFAAAAGRTTVTVLAASTVVMVDNSLTASHVDLSLLSVASAAAAVFEVAPAAADQRPADYCDYHKNDDHLLHLVAVNSWAAVGLAALGQVLAFGTALISLPKCLVAQDFIEVKEAGFVSSLHTVVPIVVGDLAVLAVFVGRGVSW